MHLMINIAILYDEVNYCTPKNWANQAHFLAVMGVDK